MMLDNNFTFREIVGHHNGFWAEGETGSSSPLPLWERVQGGLRPPSLEQDADASASAGAGERGKITRVPVPTATRRTRSSPRPSAPTRRWRLTGGHPSDAHLPPPPWGWLLP